MVKRKRFAAKARESGSRIRKCVYANTKPSHAVAACNSQHAEQKDDNYADGFIVQQDAEIQHYHHGNEQLEQQKKLALGNQVSLACLVDQLGDLAHCAMNRQILQPCVNHHAEYQSKDAEQDPE